MARELLGDEIDIHSGGEDNIFPHHECEIAQSRGVTGCQAFARYWFHTRHLMVDGTKMSKSAGTFFTIRDLLDRGASPAAIRLELVRTHYRVNSNFTFQGLRDAQRQIDRWHRVVSWLQSHASVTCDGAGPLTQALPSFKSALSDDLNIAGALGVINSAIGELDISQPPQDVEGDSTWGCELESFLAMDTVIGVLNLSSETTHVDTDQTDQIESLILARTEARAARDWGRADEIRDELLEMGIAIKDDPEGTSWQRVVQ